ncbi:MAG: hypothetical protein ACFFCE_04090 [Promethearchaeota archaeon]
MNKVKGTMLLMIVKSIKADRSKKGKYDQLLSEKGKEFLQQRILSASWYPMGYYRECFDALCLVEAKNDPKTLIKWGYLEGKRWLTTIYKSTVFKGDLHQAIEKYTRFHDMLFNFGKIVPSFNSGTELEVTYMDIPRDWKNWYYTALGWAMVFIELCIDKKADYTFLNKSWVNGGWTKIKFSWTY